MEENLYTPNSIRTHSGLYVNFTDLKPEMFIIEDIAHALSMMPRFGGHTNNFYSVARHSINCAQSTKEDAFEALMHDASEAYLMDIPSPIKKLISGYYAFEDELMDMLSKVFGFSYPLSNKIKAIDKDWLEWEWKEVFLGRNNYDTGRKQDEKDFLKLYHKLKPKK